MSADSTAPLLPKFDVNKHRSDGGGVSLAGTLQLASILCSVGILMGVLVAFISLWMYVILAFPMFMGFALGWVGKKTIERFKIRKPLTCGIAGFLAGCLCFLTMHYTEYRQFESRFDDVPPEARDIARHIDEVAARGDELPDEVREFIKQLRAQPKLLAALRVDGFWDFMNLKATEGVTITEAKKRGDGINLGYTGSIVYWGVETLILAGIAFAMMQKQAARPFCADCNVWKTEKALIDTTYPEKPIETAIRKGDLQELYQALTMAGTQKPKAGQWTRISTCFCNDCESNQTVEVKLSSFIVYNGRPSETIDAQISYPGESLEAFRTLAEMVLQSGGS